MKDMKEVRALAAEMKQVDEPDLVRNQNERDGQKSARAAATALWTQREQEREQEER